MSKHKKRAPKNQKNDLRDVKTWHTTEKNCSHFLRNNSNSYTTYFVLLLLGLALSYILPNGDWSILLLRDWSPDLSKLKDDPDWWLEDESKLLEIINSPKCNIEIKSPDELSLELLNGTYRIDRPVIIRFPEGAQDWTDPNLWSFYSLKSKYGKTTVSVGSSDEIPLNNGQGPQKISLENFINYFVENGTHPDNKYFYMFDRDLFDMIDLKRSIKEPEMLKTLYQDSSSIMFLGGALTSVSFHLHAAAWAGLIHGRKRWYLFPPNMTPLGGVPQTMTFTDWLKTNYGDSKEPKLEHLLECTQEEGDIFIVPELFHHAVINLTPVVAIGYQMNDMIAPTAQFIARWNRIFSELNKIASHKQSAERKQAIRAEYLQEAKQVFHGVSPSWNYQTNIALLSETSAEKIESFVPLLAREPDLLKIKEQMVNLNLRLGRLEKAKEYADAALVQCPTCHSVYDTYISLLTRTHSLKQIYQFRKKYGLKISASSDRKRLILEQMIIEASKLNLHQDYTTLKQMMQYIPSRESLFVQLQRLSNYA